MISSAFSMPRDNGVISNKRISLISSDLSLLMIVNELMLHIQLLHVD
jgi:hypothetical protein